MTNWFLTKATYERAGEEKRITEQYLVDAMSFTEGEARTMEHVRPFASGDLGVTAMNPINLAGLVSEGEKYFKIKVNYIVLDDKSGKEKKLPAYYMVGASDMDEAKAGFIDYMKGTLGDYAIEKIEETKILDVIKSTSEEDDKA